MPAVDIMPFEYFSGSVKWAAEGLEQVLFHPFLILLSPAAKLLHVGTETC